MAHTKRNDPAANGAEGIAVFSENTASIAEQMMLLFPTSAHCHATYNPDPKTFITKENGKIVPKYRWVFSPVTPQIWERHLAGTYPLVAALACDDGFTKVSVVDIDDYFIDHLDIVAKIKTHDLPLHVRNSKSGGAHVFAFHDVPITIDESVKVSRGISRLLGFSDDAKNIEHFPRVQEPDKNPVCLNMPFLGNDVRGSFLKRTGAQYAVEEFLYHATRCLLTTDQRAAIIRTKKHKETKPTSVDAGRKFAVGKLRRYENELKNAATHGNNLINQHGFHMGTMVAHGWVEREEIEETFRAAIAHWTDQSKHLETLDRALDDGEKQPHPDLTDEEAITEDGVALEFADRHAGDLRYDHDAASWYLWTGSHWRRDNTALAFSEARDLVRELSKDQKQRVRNITSKANFAGNVERYARADRSLVATQASWDRDPFLLGTPGGTVDLRTGKLREARPQDGLTKITAIVPAEKANCPTFDKFLQDATSGDNDLIRFLQVLCGYAMTGDISEHLLAFIYGPGGNGKSVFLNTIGGLLGDYHTAAAMETFTESHHDRHPTDLAMLRGARLVTCAETSEGRAWAETRIKQMTGGDPISARFMRRDFFTYQPTFQLLIVGNHKPQLRNITDAMRRRLAMIPFVHAPPEPDHALVEKLRAEWPGILRWMIDGCLMWQAEGIKRPDIVIETTKEYFSEQDLLGQWIEERVEKTSPAESKLLGTVLYESFVCFAQLAGEHRSGDIKWFHEQMEQHGFVRTKSHGNRVYRGVRFKPESI
jgi:putative DNA primase/helicase